MNNLKHSNNAWDNSRIGHRRRVTTNFIMVLLSLLLTLIALIPLFWIIGYVIVKGIQYINLGFFTQFPRPLGVEVEAFSMRLKVH